MKHLLWRLTCASFIFISGLCAGIMTDMILRTSERVGRVVEIIDYQDDVQKIGKTIRMELVDGSFVLFDLTERPDFTVLWKRGRIENPELGMFYRVRVNGLNEIISITKSKIDHDTLPMWSK